MRKKVYVPNFQFWLQKKLWLNDTKNPYFKLMKHGILLIISNFLFHNMVYWNFIIKTNNIFINQIDWMIHKGRCKHKSYTTQ